MNNKKMLHVFMIILLLPLLLVSVRSPKHRKHPNHLFATSAVGRVVEDLMATREVLFWSPGLCRDLT
jgi:hypothetical protein